MITCSFKHADECLATIRDLGMEIGEGMLNHPLAQIFGEVDGECLVTTLEEGKVTWRVYQPLNDGDTTWCDFVMPYDIPKNSTIAEEASCCAYRRDFFGDVVPHWAWGAVVHPSPRMVRSLKDESIQQG